MGLQQSRALEAQLEADGIVQRLQRDGIAKESVNYIAQGVAVLPQTSDSEYVVCSLRDMVVLGKVEVRNYLRNSLHAKVYLCCYDDHAEPGAAVVGS